jgi:PAS domain S-box-containing protein
LGLSGSSAKRTAEPGSSASAKALIQPYQRALLAAVVLGFVLAPIMMLIVTLEVAHEFDRSRQLRMELNQSYDERSQLQTVFSLMQDAETGQRGYIITGKANFLEPLQAAEVRIEPELKKLEAMQRANVVSYPDKAALMSRLRRLIAQRMQGLEKLVKIRTTQGAEVANERVSSGRGKQIMDDIRAVVARMSNEQIKALDQRVTLTETNGRNIETIIEALFIGLSLLLLAAYALVLRQAHTRQKLLMRVQTTAARQAAIFENAQDGIITFNPSGTVETFNRSAEKMFGYERVDIERRDVSTLLDVPSDNRLFLDRLSAGQDLAGGLTREFRARRSNGDTFPVEAALAIITLPEGDRIVASVRDISERRRIETMKAEFVSTVSHELRTPLTSIAGSLGLLMGGAGGVLPERAGRLLAIAQSNSQRLVRLINDILDIEKIESGQMRFDMGPRDLGELARKGVEGIAGMAIDTGVRLELRAAPDLPLVRGDSDRLAQVITNLLSNAVKFSPPGGLVDVTVEPRPQGRVKLSVRDHGPGIPPEFRNRIFSKFAQADASDTRQKGGTGLGLAISKEIVERHGGRLSFDSVPGLGATFVVELPVLTRAEARKDAARDSSARVLVCEDDADIAEVLSESLRQDGLAVDVVGDIAEAEAALAGKALYSALLLDVRLPDGNGLDLLQRLRSDPRTAALPVMVISGETGVGHTLDILDWMQKPIDINRLRRALDAALTENKNEQTRVLHVEDDADVRQIVADALAGHCAVIGAEGLAAARRALQLSTPDLVILDLGLGDGSGAELLPELKRPDGRGIPVVIFSAQSLDDNRLAQSVEAVLTKSKMSLDQLSDTVRELARAAGPKDSR